MAPDEPDLDDTTTDYSIKNHFNGFANTDTTDVSTATPNNYYPYDIIDFDNRHERRKKKALARKKRNK